MRTRRPGVPGRRAHVTGVAARAGAVAAVGLVLALVVTGPAASQTPPTTTTTVASTSSTSTTAASTSTVAPSTSTTTRSPSTTARSTSTTRANGSSGASGSGGSAGSAGGTGGESVGGSTMTLVAQSAWVAPVDTFSLQVDAGTVPVDASVVARIYVPISTQDQLDHVAKGQSMGARVESVAVPASSVGRDPDGTLSLDYPLVASGSRSATGFLLTNPGVYPFSLAVVDSSGRTISQLLTQLIRLPAGSTGSTATTTSSTSTGSTSGPTTSNATSSGTPLQVALVVPYGSAVGHHPDRAATLSPSVLAALGAETAALGQQTGVAVTVTPTPETIDTLADHDRTTGSHLLADLRAAIAHRATLSGPYVPVDSGAWVAHDLSAGYDDQLQAGDQALVPLGAGVTHTAAVLDPTATAESLSRVVGHGAGVVVVPSDRLAAQTTRSSTPAGPLTQWFDLSTSDGGHVAAVPADTTLSTTLASGDDPVLAAHQVLAALALVSLDHSGSQACIRQIGQPCRRGVAL